MSCSHLLIYKETTFQFSLVKDRFTKSIRHTMDRIQIVQLAKRMKTKEDLLALLNQIMTGETSELKTYPSLFTMKQLNYYCNPNHDRGRYTQFKIKKKTGGERQITAPRSQTFRWILRYVNEIFKAMYQPSPYAIWGLRRGVRW